MRYLEGEPQASFLRGDGMGELPQLLPLASSIKPLNWPGFGIRDLFSVLVWYTE